MENTALFLQNRIDSEKCGKDWLCSENLVSSLGQTKFYKSQNQFFPTDNIPPLELVASLLDSSNIPPLESDASLQSSKGRRSVPFRSIETWEKRACKLIAINSLQQQSMSVPALSSLLEAVAKSIKHGMTMSMILATELFQARPGAALATSKLLLEDSCYELRNVQINAKTLFGNMEDARGNFGAQQQRFLASSLTATNLQKQQQTAYLAPTVFKRPRQLKKPSRPKQMQLYRPKSQTQS